MELTRRDAAAALVAIGAAGGAAGGAMVVGRRQVGDEPGGSDGHDDPDDGDELPGTEQVHATMTAVAEVLYPDGVAGVAEFVDVFLDSRIDRADHWRGIQEAVAELEDLARAWYGSGVSELSVEERDRLLRAVGADDADEDPAGTTAERVRFYVVNELLLALYASPKGGELVGIENPQGYAGGTESYTRGPG